MGSVTKIIKNSPFFVTILWGEAPQQQDSPIEYGFETQAELDAFLYGMAEMDGWGGYEITDSSDEKQA